MPAILVQVVHKGETTRQWVRANEYARDSLIRFDDPSVRPHAFVLCSWQEGRALAAAYRNGESLGVAPLEAGQPWSPDGAAYALRLDQALASAVPVNAEDSPLWEAVLDADGRAGGGDGDTISRQTISRVSQCQLVPLF